LREKFYIAALLGLIGIFHAATVRPGHIWGDDFAMYVHHARNIVEHRPYTDTGYIPNPSVPVYGPKYYPPVFPVLLAPVYRAYGMNVIPMKLEQVLFLVLTLVVVYALWRRELGREYSLALVAILGFAPAFWIAKDEVLSDLPFLFLFYAVVLLVERLRGEQRRLSGCARSRSALIGFAIYLAMGTRTVGIALLAGLALYDLLRCRRVTRYTAVSIAVCVGCAIAQRYILGIGGSGYPYQAPSVHTIAGNIAEYTRVLAAFWVGSMRGPLAYAVLVMFASFALAGFFLQCKRDISFLEAALVPYLAIIVLWPFPAGIRMMFPLVPWVGYLAVFGCKSLAEKIVPRYCLAAAGAFVLVIAACYAQFYREADFGPIHQTAGLAEFNQLCQAVRDSTTAQDPIIYRRARALSLYTGRPASVANHLGSQAELWRWAAAIHAKYLVTTNAFNDDEEFLTRFVESNAGSVDLVYENANFKLYRIRSFPLEPEAPALRAIAAPPA
jgi:4-amino-4-deoxy-L-arabinose transferase-like glycosyltransferase